MKVTLDARLQAVADLVPMGKPAADIGSDHNYLSAYLVSHRICPFVIASDKSPSSYEKSKNLAQLFSLGKQIDVRLGDGLSVLQPAEVSTIIMAGMGGLLMRDILAAGPTVLSRTERLVLQPQKHVEEVRAWLMKNNWKIVAEDIVRDRSFFYFIVAAEQGKCQLSQDDLDFGPCLLAEKHPLLPLYLRSRRDKASALLQKLKEEPGFEAEQRCVELQEEINNIKRIAKQFHRGDA